MSNYLKRKIKKYKTYKDFPDWRMCRCPDAQGRVAYDIFKRRSRKEELSIYLKYKLNDNSGYNYVGTLCENGILKSGYLDGDEPFFGRNLKNAIRFLFLKMQEPIKK